MTGSIGKVKSNQLYLYGAFNKQDLKKRFKDNRGHK